MNSPTKRLGIYLALGATTLGAGLGGAAIAGAATNGTSTTTNDGTAATTPGAATDRPDPATIDHGPGETLLTGTTAEKVKAAALAAVPGATIIRVETDSGGSPYEAHITKSDGSQATVLIDADFKVTSTEDGFGGGPGHGPGAPSDTPAA